MTNILSLLQLILWPKIIYPVPCTLEKNVYYVAAVFLFWGGCFWSNFKDFPHR